MSLRHCLYQIFESQNLSECSPQVAKYAYIVNWGLVVLILTNIIAVILESIDDIYYPNQAFFDFFEVFSVVIFSFEYLARIWVIAEKNPHQLWRARLKYAFSFRAIIDLLAIITMFFPTSIIDLRFLRIFRLLSLFKLTRYFNSLCILLVVIEKERHSFGAVLFILFLLILFSASGIYVVEYHAQPEAFNSIPHAMWWAVVTLTTVGYGDITPITPAGKMLGAFITILGVGIAALPAGILATGLAQELEHQKQEKINQFYDELMALSLTQLHNYDTTDAIADALKIDLKNRQVVLTQAIREKQFLEKEKVLEEREQALNKKCFCPYCGNSLGN